MGRRGEGGRGTPLYPNLEASTCHHGSAFPARRGHGEATWLILLHLLNSKYVSPFQPPVPSSCVPSSDTGQALLQADSEPFKIPLRAGGLPWPVGSGALGATEPGGSPSRSLERSVRISEMGLITAATSNSTGTSASGLSRGGSRGNSCGQTHRHHALVWAGLCKPICTHHVSLLGNRGIPASPTQLFRDPQKTAPPHSPITSLSQTEDAFPVGKGLNMILLSSKGCRPKQSEGHSARAVPGGRSCGRGRPADSQPSLCAGQGHPGGPSGGSSSSPHAPVLPPAPAQYWPLSDTGNPPELSSGG